MAVTGAELDQRSHQPIDQETVAAVLREINQLGRTLKDLIRPEFTRGLHLGSVAMLGQLERAGRARCSEIAERTGLDVSVVSRQLSHLDRLGLTTRDPDPSDGRAWLSRLTPDGVQLLADLRRRSHQRLVTVLSGWNDAELISLNHQLTRLNHDLLLAAEHEPERDRDR